MEWPCCECGNDGCLEAYASEKAILKKMKEESEHYPESLLHEMKEDQLSIRSLFKAANDGDELAVSILDESGKYLGIAAANMVNILKPSKIILEGHIFEEGPYMVDAVKEMVEKYTFKSSPENITIVCSDLGKKGMVLGAVTLILKKIFKTGRMESV
jgi:N-acetylglucosamine repressor